MLRFVFILVTVTTGYCGVLDVRDGVSTRKLESESMSEVLVGSVKTNRTAEVEQSPNDKFARPILIEPVVAEEENTVKPAEITNKNDKFAKPPFIKLNPDAQPILDPRSNPTVDITTTLRPTNDKFVSQEYIQSILANKTQVTNQKNDTKQLSNDKFASEDKEENKLLTPQNLAEDLKELTETFLTNDKFVGKIHLQLVIKTKEIQNKDDIKLEENQKVLDNIPISSIEEKTPCKEQNSPNTAKKETIESFINKEKIESSSKEGANSQSSSEEGANSQSSLEGGNVQTSSTEVQIQDSSERPNNQVPTNNANNHPSGSSEKVQSSSVELMPHSDGFRLTPSTEEIKTSSTESSESSIPLESQNLSKFPSSVNLPKQLYHQNKQNVSKPNSEAHRVTKPGNTTPKTTVKPSNSVKPSGLTTKSPNSTVEPLNSTSKPPNSTVKSPNSTANPLSSTSKPPNTSNLAVTLKPTVKPGNANILVQNATRKPLNPPNTSLNSSQKPIKLVVTPNNPKPIIAGALPNDKFVTQEYIESLKNKIKEEVTSEILNSNQESNFEKYVDSLTSNFHIKSNPCESNCEDEVIYKQGDVKNMGGDEYVRYVTRKVDPPQGRTDEDGINFSFLRGANVPCSTINGNTGTCLPFLVCKELNGTNSNNPQHNNGGCGSIPCCEISKGCSETISTKIGYFQNPPQTGSSCRVSVKAFNQNVCQIRLDFEEFRLAGPTQQVGSINSAVSCRDDSMVIIAPNGLTIPILCGSMKGQHLYIPINTTDGEMAVQLVMNLGPRPGLIPPRWKIKITQLECPVNLDVVTSAPVMKDDFVTIAPHGCLQYFTEPQGSVCNFGYDQEKPISSNLYIANHKYAICFKRRPNNCGIRFTSSTFQLSGRPNECSGDYLFIPGGEMRNSGNINTQSNYCEKMITTDSEVISMLPGPFNIQFITDNVGSMEERGWCLNYRIFSTGNCL